MPATVEGQLIHGGLILIICGVPCIRISAGTGLVLNHGGPATSIPERQSVDQ